MLHICNICQYVHAYSRQICQYIYLIWTHCNQQYDHKHYFIYISHYWHMPLSICLPYHICMSHYTSHIFHCRPYITAYISQTKQWMQCIYQAMTICITAINMLKSPAYMPITSYTDMRQSYQYMYLIWSQCNEKCLIKPNLMSLL